MRKSIYILGFIGISFFGHSQQQAVYSNFLMNDYYYNPAIAGSKDVHEANITYRNQWVGFDGAPSLLMGNFQGSVNNQQKMGYGVSILSETAGITQNTGIYLNYAHHFKLSEKLRLGLGVQPGYTQYRVKLYDAQLADQGDEVLTGTVYSANAIDVSSGFHLYSEKFFLMGSIHHMLSKDVQFTQYNGNLDFHFNTIAGYTFSFNSDPKKKKKPFDLQPSVMIKYAHPAPIQWTAMLKGTLNKRFWVGLIYRSDDAAGISLGAQIRERFSVAYGYDYTLSRLSNFQAGSHEIMLSFVITKDKPSLAEEDDKLNNSIIEELKKKIEEKEKQEKQEQKNN
ncbi:MAG: type IX secretion system membrane protein PorP/SprF [Crocinitomicaceae bacterium]|nr:type IX secretion system membrane protein PorP/SprF [Crocinitomicaceae bacterium]